MIYDLFLQQVARHPNKIAVDVGEEQLSYIGLQRLVESLSAVKDAERFSVINSELIGLSGILTLLYAARFNKCVAANCRVPFIETDNKPYLLVPTSGTTGEPKLVALSQECKVRRVEQFRAMVDLTEEDSLLCASPLSLSLGQRLVFSALLTGCRLNLVERYSTEKWLEQARKSSIVVGVPQQLENFKLTGDRPRLVVNASARMTYVPEECLVLNTYGTSEVAFVMYGVSTTEHIFNHTFLFYAPGVDVGLDSAGEILVRSSTEFDGYYGQPEMTAAKYTAAGFFRTGDVGKFSRDGHLQLLGRLDDRIRVGAHTVYPEEVEAALRRAGYTQDFAVIGAIDDDLGEVVCVCVKHQLVEQGSMVQIQLSDDFLLINLQHACLDQGLSDAALPRRLLLVSSIPRTAAGKVKRQELTACYGQE